MHKSKDAERVFADTRSSPRRWSFGGFSLDERRLELKRGDEILRLDRKPMEVLMYLLRHAGEVVTKDELADAVWPGRIITDSNLSKTVALLRAGLGGSGAQAIKTVHGYGYRLAVPVKLYEASAGMPPLSVELRPGLALPLRPHWLLERRLGSGAHGDAWLVRHGKTGQCRVFKFASGGQSLAALKREVALNRLLQETLPGRCNVLPVLDWNFELAPYFLETEYAAGGDLAVWAESQGGWRDLPLALRLEIVAQVADAVAAMHSVGVLHKDLKPSNILMASAGTAPEIRLADLGSGGLLDDDALQNLGITGLGMTQADDWQNTGAATLQYLAPEVLAGQPFTVKSDLYALGVLLYQLIAGDTRKPLAPGWEKDVPDELLRDDIAAAAAGDPADRLRDAALLASLLRTLPQRQAQRSAQRRQAAQAERSLQLRAALRRWRFVVLGLAVLSVAAVGAGILAIRAEQQALRAVAAAQAVNDFLIKDLLAYANPTLVPTRDMSVRELLQRAANGAEARFSAQPAAAAEVFATLGEAFTSLGDMERARQQLTRALDLYAQVHGTAAMKTLDLRGRLALVLDALGRVDEACEMLAAVDRQLAVLPGLDPRQRLVHRAASSTCLYRNGDFELALLEIGELVELMEAQGLVDSGLYEINLARLAAMQFDRFEFAEAERQYRKLVAHSESRLGPAHIITTRNRGNWAGALIFSGQLDLAEQQIHRASEDRRDWLGDGAESVGNLSVWQAILRLEQGRAADAERLARTCLDGELGQQKRGTYRLASLLVLGEAQLLQGRFAEADISLHELIEQSVAMGLPDLWYEAAARILRAEALLRLARPDEARELLSSIGEQLTGKYPPDSIPLAALSRVRGLLQLQAGELQPARYALDASRRIYTKHFGATHWRSVRVRGELETLAAVTD